ncbi:MAG: hypothetical protein JWN11_1009 [Hyphomicrobiales bacterium]|nr:hypothetical protein [Hyphomicrobiales bacterium]
MFCQKDAGEENSTLAKTLLKLAAANHDRQQEGNEHLWNGPAGTLRRANARKCCGSR